MNLIAIDILIPVYQDKILRIVRVILRNHGCAPKSA